MRVGGAHATRLIAATTALVITAASLLSSTHDPASAASESSGSPATGLATDTGATADRVLLGVYRWDHANIAPYESWIGTDVDLGEDFLTSGDGPCSMNWAQIEGHGWQLDPWAAWVAAKSGRNVVLSVPMLSPNQPGNSSIGCWHVDADAIAAELRTGATGAYNSHFRALAQNLVSRGLGNAKLRIGWEAGGNWFRDQFGPDVAAWKGLFRQIVTTMRSVPGANFEFVFNAGTTSWTKDLSGRVVPVTEAYPGDDVVDNIGFDVYCGGSAPWSTYLDGWGTNAWVVDPGLTFWANFADAHHKPMSFPEWGVRTPQECGDSNGALPFIQNMHDWMATHNVAWHVYFDVNPSCSYIMPNNQCAWVSDGDHQLMPASDGRVATHYPQASALYKSLFGQPVARAGD
jgi:hypothetical protein